MIDTNNISSITNSPLSTETGQTINNNIGDPSAHDLTSITAKLGDDSNTIKQRFDTVDSSISTVDGIVDTINTNLGDPSSHTLTNITAKFGDDSNTVKQRFDSIDSIIGAFNDFVNIPFTQDTESVIAYLQTWYYHVHGESFAYPRLANSVTLTSGAGAWDNTGAITEIIPANTLLKPFDLHWCNVFTISGNCEGLIEIFTGSVGNEVLIGETKIFRNVAVSVEGQRRIQIPQQLANARISARLSDNTAGTITAQVSFEGHYYG